MRKDVQYLRVMVSQLRGKIEADPASPPAHPDRTGSGYRFGA